MQKAAVGIEAEKYLAIEAKQRQIQAGDKGSLGGRGNKKTLVEKIPQGFINKKIDNKIDEGKSREQAAGLVGVNECAGACSVRGCGKFSTTSCVSSCVRASVAIAN